MNTYASCLCLALVPPATIPQEAFAASPRTIKLLDLLSNRYYIGVIREDWGYGMSLEFPLTSQLQSGQAVRFIIAGSQALVARREMRSALITRAHRTSRTTQVELTFLVEAAAA